MREDGEGHQRGEGRDSPACAEGDAVYEAVKGESKESRNPHGMSLTVEDLTGMDGDEFFHNEEEKEATKEGVAPIHSGLLSGLREEMEESRSKEDARAESKEEPQVFRTPSCDKGDEPSHEGGCDDRKA